MAANPVSLRIRAMDNAKPSVLNFGPACDGLRDRQFCPATNRVVPRGSGRPLGLSQIKLSGLVLDDVVFALLPARRAPAADGGPPRRSW